MGHSNRFFKIKPHRKSKNLVLFRIEAVFSLLELSIFIFNLMNFSMTPELLLNSFFIVLQSSLSSSIAHFCWRCKRPLGSLCELLLRRPPHCQCHWRQVRHWMTSDSDNMNMWCEAPQFELSRAWHVVSLHVPGIKVPRTSSLHPSCFVFSLLA